MVVKENNRFLTVTEIASMLRTKERTIREWCYERIIPHYKVGNALLFKIDEVLDWVDEHCRVDMSTSINDIERSLRKPKIDSKPPKLHIDEK
jgi:excisionase family DNA binding protein